MCMSLCVYIRVRIHFTGILRSDWQERSLLAEIVNSGGTGKAVIGGRQAWKKARLIHLETILHFKGVVWAIWAQADTTWIERGGNRGSSVKRRRARKQWDGLHDDQWTFWHFPFSHNGSLIILLQMRENKGISFYISTDVIELACLPVS